jgi:uncharacterized membrane protein
MGFFELTLILATFLCSLVAGFLFAFAIVVMPGIGRLDPRGFIRAFQVMDGVIQNNQPLFLVVWLGSVVSLILAAVLGMGQLDSLERWLLIACTLGWILGIQVPTITINIPLNNRLQALDADTLSVHELQSAHASFEARWNRWNRIRTVLACMISVALIVLAFSL